MSFDTTLTSALESELDVSESKDGIAERGLSAGACATCDDAAHAACRL